PARGPHRFRLERMGRGFGYSQPAPAAGPQGPRHRDPHLDLGAPPKLALDVHGAPELFYPTRDALDEAKVAFLMQPLAIEGEPSAVIAHRHFRDAIRDLGANDRIGGTSVPGDVPQGLTDRLTKCLNDRRRQGDREHVDLALNTSDGG